MRHVDPAIGVGRREARVAEQPPPDEVVGLAVGEQQAVGGLVHQRGELGVGAAHQHEPDRPRPRSEADRRPQHERGLRVEPDDTQRVADRGDPPQLGAEVGVRATVGPDALGVAAGSQQLAGNTMPPSRRDPITGSSIMPLASSLASVNRPHHSSDATAASRRSSFHDRNRSCRAPLGPTPSPVPSG